MASKTAGENSNLEIELNALLDKISQEVKDTNDLQSLQDLKISYLGRKSELTNILKGIKDLSNDQKKVVGQKANKVRLSIETLLQTKEEKLTEEILTKKINQESIDVTLPGKKSHIGRLHPVTQMLRRAEDIFANMGFEIVYPFEIDDDYHIFEALNFPDGHPARDNWDTFSTADNHMPIPHTSAMQNRVLRAKETPIRAVVPGRCFRNESTDARHEHTFFQMEGVYVDKGITLAHMLGTLKTFFEEFYEQKIDVKFTPDYFPFVEPGGMMSLTCVLCEGKGCRVCKKTGWLEILGCGMIHPEVLKEAGIDPEVYSGFAWGFGLERLIMLKYNIEDIRHFYSGNLKFIRQF